MAPVTASAIEQAFSQADLSALPSAAYSHLAGYVATLQRWNARLNLTALRSPEEVVKRHLVECAFVAEHLPRDIETLMDYGTGAGLPGVVVAICRPEIAVTLAEAHARKASFLREVLRSVGIPAQIYEGRVEQLPPERQFHAVTMRAVEKMGEAIPIALRHTERYLALMSTVSLIEVYRERFGALTWETPVVLPNTEQMLLAIAVPCGAISPT